MKRLTATDRAAQMLAIVPWIVERGRPSIAEVCSRFDISERQLRKDLDTLGYVSTYPHTFDTMNEVIFHGDRVEIIPGPYFRRPLKLTPAQALSVIAAAKAASSIRGADDDGPLQRALRKLESTVVSGSGRMIEVELGNADSGVLDVVQRGAAEGRQVEIDYYSFHRDDRSVRVIDPYRVTHRDGTWNVIAHCHTADGLRQFRVDRIVSATLLEDAFTKRAGVDDERVYAPSPASPRVVLRLRPDAAWVADAVPHDAVEAHGDGSLSLTLAVDSDVWFARLMVGLGPSAAIESVSGADAGREADIRGLVAAEATTILKRYRT